ncbi:MAG: apolipoprotein A1/A4/E family protein [Ruminococcus sp.]|uniref:hypothetical protein n=1 Tax=Ruminococcus sp. TaxID=41978 RepID=UPI0025EF2037|nr:hypothetical protein [Ruminococcus sp.]MCR5601448.1 apolipoprotein A1/A4/E family protein [Ruminococcus sp.]
MAFCRFCGKQIPEGGVCDCPEAQKKAAEEISNAPQSAEQAVESVKEAAAEVKNEAVQAAETVQETVKETASEVKENVADSANKPVSGADIAKKVDGLAGEISENLPGNMKNSKNAVYIAACIVAVLILMLLMCLFGGGAKSAVKKYVKAASSKSGGKTYYSYTYPKQVIKKLKKKDKFDDMVDDFNEKVEDAIDDLEDKETMPKFAKIVSKSKLNDSELDGAEDYFEGICEIYDVDDDIEVSKGYEMKIKTKCKDEDGDTEYHKTKICVVKIKGDGWKIIPASKNSLD